MSLSSVLIILAIVAGGIVTGLLYYKRTGTVTAVLALYLIGFILGVLLSRFLHWYSSSTTYTSLGQALTDFEVGTFCSSGLVLAAIIAGALVGLLPICGNGDILMDCEAPGFALMMAIIRISAWGTGKCQGGKNITTGFLQTLPFAVSGTDAAGNEYYRFATFFISALLYLIVFFLLLSFYKSHLKTRMKKPAKRFGNVWKMLLTLYSAIEIVLDSTRVDSMHFTFKKILTLNRFSTFISIGQVVPFVIFLCVFIYYLKCSVQANGWSLREILSIPLFMVATLLIGFLGEYKWQRNGSYWSYLAMVIGAVTIAVVIYELYKACIRPPRRKRASAEIAE